MRTIRQNKMEQTPVFLGDEHMQNACGIVRLFLTKNTMKPGSIVCCVDASNWDEVAFTTFNTLPTLHHIYTVREIFPNIEKAGGPPGVAVEGIKGKYMIVETLQGEIKSMEAHFRMTRFEELLPPREEAYELSKVKELVLVKV